ncbi:hypothetical protein [Streptosporangium sp. NPDC051022]
MTVFIPGRVYELTPERYVAAGVLRQQALMATADECRACGNQPTAAPN